ncbi:hypothetical protein WMY93_033594 [Mugilogobius chulae]|uniref:Copper amine oxidase N2-terminal domain-containing protein n=1 Tax=Mugilogobius chulae TaxID=88201 RepID=A0AAW0MMF4_9GOBI
MPWMTVALQGSSFAFSCLLWRHSQYCEGPEDSKNTAMVLEVAVPATDSVEVEEVQEYLLRQKDLNISTRQSTRPDHNFLFLIDLHRPTKPEVLKHQDAHGPAPQRGHSSGLLWGQSSHQDVTLERYGKELPLSAWNVTIGECMLMFQFLEVKVFLPLSRFLHESFRVDAQKKLNAFEQMPRGIWTGEHKTWISLWVLRSS